MRRVKKALALAGAVVSLSFGTFVPQGGRIVVNPPDVDTTVNPTVEERTLPPEYTSRIVDRTSRIVSSSTSFADTYLDRSYDVIVRNLTKYLDVDVKTKIVPSVNCLWKEGDWCVVYRHVYRLEGEINVINWFTVGWFGTIHYFSSLVANNLKNSFSIDYAKGLGVRTGRRWSPKAFDNGLNRYPDVFGNLRVKRLSYSPRTRNHLERYFERRGIPPRRCYSIDNGCDWFCYSGAAYCDGAELVNDRFIKDLYFNRFSRGWALEKGPFGSISFWWHTNGTIGFLSAINTVSLSFSTPMNVSQVRVHGITDDGFKIVVNGRVKHWGYEDGGDGLDYYTQTVNVNSSVSSIYVQDGGGPDPIPYLKIMVR